MTDQAILRSKVQEITAASGFMELIGTEVLEVSDGFVSLQVRQSPTLQQFSGLFHGGLISTLADFAGGGAAAVATPPNPIVLTTDLHVTFLQAAKGTRLWAEARCVRAGKTLRVSRVDVFSDDPDPRTRVAVATVTLVTRNGS